MRALVADHGLESRARTRRIATNLGFEVLEAGDDEEAMACLAEYDRFVDLVLVEWDLPSLGGLAFVERVRNTVGLADLAMLLSGSALDPQQIARALMLGADDCLSKPLDEAAVRDKLALLGLFDSSS
ncbi:MAG: response regulator [Gaiellaceae bacterium]